MVRGIPWFLVGLVLFIVGPVIYAVQFSGGKLTTPWHAPILASVGLALMLLSVAMNRGWIRIVGCVFFALVCGLEWFMMLHATRVPAYAGPARPGVQLPAFAANFADGKEFSPRDLSTGEAKVMVFFRGRW